MKNSSNEEKDNTSKNNEIKSNLDKDEENESVKLDKDSSEVNTENLVEKEKSIEENDEISKKKSIHEKTNSQICESDKTSSDETKIESSKKVHEDESEKNTSQSGEEGTSGKKKLFSNKATEEYSLEEMGGDCNMDKEKDSSKETTKNTHDESYVLSDSEKDEPRKKKLAENSSESDSEKKRKRGKKKIDEDVITINSEDSNDSDDFSTFCVKKKLIRNAKKEIKKIISESESEENEKSEGNEKSENSDAEYEDQKSDGESSDSSSKTEKEKQDRPSKRRRIKQVNDDSSGSDSKVTRKKIKKVISKNSLSDETKKAEAEERERRQRIFEKQKKYNQIYENADLASSKVDKLILDIDEKTEKPLLEVGKDLVSKLKPHQASGIQFMWDACFESLEMAKSNEGSGCILAHCMGLGKTLQVIALATTLLESAEETNVRKVLIVTPLSTVLNWKSEFNNWLSGDEDFEVYELVTCKTQNAERAHYIKQWHQNGGVMIISYAMFRNLSNDKNKKVSKKLRTTFYEGLVDPGPDLVVCDEGHLLKNEKTGLSIAMNKIKTRRRIVLTGTPLQNNLKEYYCMVQFVKPSLLGTYKEYLNRFVNPITNGQYTDSTQYDINIMRRRSHVLHKLLEGIVQRRDYSVLSPYLPPKHEYVLFLTLTDTQKKLYSHYLNHFARKSKEGSNRTSYLFQDFQAFSRICIHPRVLLDKSAEDQQKYKSDDEESIGSLKDFICDESDTTTPECSESESNSEESDKNKKKSVSRRVTRAQRADKKSGSESEVEEVQESEKEWWQEFCDGEELDNIAHGTKILMLLEILKECEQIGDKVLVFSQSLYALNVIEYFLAKVDEATQNGNANEKTCGYTGSWAFGLDYFRLDGSTNCNTRSTWCDNFNKESNTRARLFLLSTRAGGLGINLVAANRVIIFDVSWNPSSDIQSIYRVYRFGQLKPSYIYRFVIYGTMEMKIYERQVTKQAISKRVIDEQQIDRHYNQNDLAELYKFEPGSEDRPIPLVPKDVLLGELLQHHEDKIFKYHEHQSLLENKEDETLNEEERKAAWEEFENEKVARTKQNLIGKFSVNTVQLALKSIIQRDNPTWNNNQILSIIPQLMEQLIFQLNANDTTMYNKIATEVKHMQDEYARKMQMQFMQYRMQMEAQRRQQQFGPQHLNAYARFPNPYLTGQFQQYFMGTPANAFGASTSNSNDVVELN
ncbi:hypothetical protein HHI36_002797 [Cryptolaemus montrouzieri]|uniref:Transcriptional regulator ATRX homolog n=1 Tax=Cryptolaemus montrouzieri TaxID=559131 RepID=A0ABD2PBI4_9CUCU